MTTMLWPGKHLVFEGDGSNPEIEAPQPCDVDYVVRHPTTVARGSSRGRWWMFPRPAGERGEWRARSSETR